MASVSYIIDNMSSDIRKKAQAFADARGLSLEQAVAQQLEVELNDASLSSVAGGGETNIEFIGEVDIETAAT